MKPISHRSYLAIAVPFIVSTVTQPLLGAVDTAVVGRLESASYIGGVPIGTVIFNTLYWLFGFLRVGTSGFSAQSPVAPSSTAARFPILCRCEIQARQVPRRRGRLRYRGSRVLRLAVDPNRAGRTFLGPWDFKLDLMDQFFLERRVFACEESQAFV